MATLEEIFVSGYEQFFRYESDECNGKTVIIYAPTREHFREGLKDSFGDSMTGWQAEEAKNIDITNVVNDNDIEFYETILKINNFKPKRE